MQKRVFIFFIEYYHVGYNPKGFDQYFSKLVLLALSLILKNQSIEKSERNHVVSSVQSLRLEIPSITVSGIPNNKVGYIPTITDKVISMSDQSEYSDKLNAQTLQLYTYIFFFKKDTTSHHSIGDLSYQYLIRNICIIM